MCQVPGLFKKAKIIKVFNLKKKKFLIRDKSKTKVPILTKLSPWAKQAQINDVQFHKQGHIYVTDVIGS